MPNAKDAQADVKAEKAAATLNPITDDVEARLVALVNAKRNGSASSGDEQELTRLLFALVPLPVPPAPRVVGA